MYVWGHVIIVNVKVYMCVFVPVFANVKVATISLRNLTYPHPIAKRGKITPNKKANLFSSGVFFLAQTLLEKSFLLLLFLLSAQETCWLEISYWVSGACAMCRGRRQQQHNARCQLHNNLVREEERRARLFLLLNFCLTK